MKEERIDDQDVASLVEGTDDAPNERVGEIHACDGFSGGCASAREGVGDSSRLESEKTELQGGWSSGGRKDHHLSQSHLEARLEREREQRRRHASKRKADAPG